MKQYKQILTILTALILFLPFSISAQSGFFELDSLETFQFGGTGGSDCWGYTAPDKTEYAIMGVFEGIVFVNTSDMSVAGLVEGPNLACTALWRDIKTYKNYCYSVSECGGTNSGLSIIDLQYLPDSVHFVGAFAFDSAGIGRGSHNLSIDTVKGFVYVESGGSPYSTEILSLENPEQPEWVGGIKSPGIHDVYAYNDTAYLAEGGNSSFAIYNCTDKKNTTLIKRVNIPSGGYVHNIWSTENRQFVITTEETQGKTVKVWDIRDYKNISMISEYLGESGLAHNAHVQSDYLFLSHYTGGVKVVDMLDPFDIMEVANFSTSTGGGGFSGCWGVYPHTQNGMVFASNMNGKLFILQSSLTTQYPAAWRFNLGEDNSLNVVNHHPTFYWTFRDTVGLQNGYQLEIGTDEDWSVAEMWFTGEVFGADTSVSYAGDSLYDGETYYFRIRVNNGVEWGEWKESKIRMNSIPSVPVPLSPIADEIVSIFDSKLSLIEATDAETAKLIYNFEIYFDSELTILIVSDTIEDITGTNISESSQINGLAIGRQYFWRCRAFDKYEYSSWSQAESFVTRGGQAFLIPTTYATIQDGIDQVSVGDTVMVLPGTYTENLVISRDLRVISKDGPKSTVIIPMAADETVLRMINITGYAEFSGFTIGPECQKLCVLVDDSKNIIFKNNIIRDYVGTSFIVSFGNCDATISNNLFINNKGQYTLSIAQGNINIFNNTFHNNSIAAASTNESADFENNIISNSTSYGVIGNFGNVDYNNTFKNSFDYVIETPLGPNNINFNPQYQNPDLGNFYLSASSQCIDAGNPASEFNDPDGSRNDIGAYPFDLTTAIGDDDKSLPYRFALFNNYPNPFNPSTNISFSLAKKSDVSLSVININGRLVKELIDKQLLAAGIYEYEWDGKNSSGSHVSSGIYFYRITAGDFVSSKKMLLLK